MTSNIVTLLLSSNVTKRFSNDTAYVLIYCQQKPGNTSFELDVDPILRSDLSDTVFKDNEAYHKVISFVITVIHILKFSFLQFYVGDFMCLQ